MAKRLKIRFSSTALEPQILTRFSPVSLLHPQLWQRSRRREEVMQFSLKILCLEVELQKLNPSMNQAKKLRKIHSLCLTWSNKRTLVLLQSFILIKIPRLNHRSTISSQQLRDRNCHHSSHLQSSQTSNQLWNLRLINNREKWIMLRASHWMST